MVGFARLFAIECHLAIYIIAHEIIFDVTFHVIGAYHEKNSFEYDCRISKRK